MSIVFSDSLSSEKEYTIKFKDFKGVDYANTKLNVANNRATETRNMIHDNSVNRKRNGWIQRAFISDSSGNPLKINGYWEMKDKNGIIHNIVHAGTKIFRIFFGEEVLETKVVDLTKTNTYYPSYSTLATWTEKIIKGIKNVKSYGIVRGNRLYIFAGGAYLVYGTWNEKVCDNCNGSGVLTDCSLCGGTKKIQCPTCNADGTNTTGKINCPTCGGDGKVDCSNHSVNVTTCPNCTEGKIVCPNIKNHCANCGGTGFIDCELCGNTGYIDHCDLCGGTSEEDADPDCPRCYGMGGLVECKYCYGGTNGQNCSECNGAWCKTCKGVGTITCTTCNGNYESTKVACEICGTISGRNVSDCTNIACDNGKIACTQNGCQNGFIECPNCKNSSSATVCSVCNGTGKVTADGIDSFELRLVQDNVDTYIPTTTIGIAPNGSNMDGNRVTLEESNMLSMRRKNKLVWTTFKNSINVLTDDYFSNALYENSNEWAYVPNKICYMGYVDARIISGMDLTFTVNNIQYQTNIDYESNKISTGWVNISSNSKLNELITDFDTTLLSQISIQMYKSSKGKVYFRVALGSDYTLSIDDITLIVETYQYQLDCTKIDNNYPVTVKSNGYVIESENYSVDYENGTIKFNNSNIFEDSIYTPKVEGESNIIVEFTPVHSNYQLQANKINNCRFGTMFGYNDAEYFFASGNSDYPNVDWHTVDRDSSETDAELTEYEDLTYFGELSYSVVGGEMSSITGYSLLGDETLAILKESSPNEPTMFIRKATLGDVITLDGTTLDYQKVYFSQYSTSSSEGCLSFHTIDSLAGDKLFLSKHGIFGITLSSNIKSNERFARERSRFINPVLVKEDLKNAVAIVFENRYYLAINNKMYIADSRYSSQYDVEMDDTYTYEYWVWEWKNANITTLFVKDDKLWFGTDDGKICSFHESKNYVDKAYRFTNLNGGSLTLGTGFSSNIFTINSDYEINNGDKIMISGDNSPLYEVVLERSDMKSIKVNSKTNESTITVTNSALLDTVRFAELDKVYIYDMVNALVDNTIKIGKVYYIKDIDYINNTFKLVDENENPVVIGEETRFGLIKKLTGVNEISKAASKTKFRLVGYNEENLMNYKSIVSSYNGITNTVYIGAFPEFNNVECIWYTSIVNMGTSDYTKNLKYLTIVPDAISNGEIKAGVITKRNDKEMFYQLDTKGVDTYNLDELGFTQFSFDCSVFARAYTKKVKIKNASFAQLFFASLDKSDCVVNEISLTYSIGKRNKGVRL